VAAAPVASTNVPEDREVFPSHAAVMFADLPAPKPVAGPPLAPTFAAREIGGRPGGGVGHILRRGIRTGPCSRQLQREAARYRRTRPRDRDRDQARRRHGHSRVSDIVPDVAVITVVPAARGLTRPVASTVATAVLEENHV
jgi:hypothetical protein